MNAARRNQRQRRQLKPDDLNVCKGSDDCISIARLWFWV
jgi:hypothetical protein